MKKNLKKYKIEIMAFFIGLLAYFTFINLFFSTEVLFLASFMGDIDLVGKFFEESLSFSDLFSHFGEHGMLGYNILLIINAYLFDYTVYFDLVINVINVSIVAALFLYSISKTLDNNKYYSLGILFIVFILFNNMQGSSSTMETQVRLGILFFVLIMYFVDRTLRVDRINKFLYISIALGILAINVFGTAYSFAGYPILFLLLFYLSIFRKNRSAIFFIFFFLILFVFYLYEYSLLGGTSSVSNRGLLVSMYYWILNPLELIDVLSGYYSSSLLGYATLANKLVNKDIYLYIGYFIILVNIFTVFLYYKSKMYKKTYLPIIFIGYTFFVIILAAVGRYPNVDWTWGVNPWYHVHTKIGLASVVWILLFSNKKLVILRVPIVVFLVSIFIIMLYGSYNDLKRAPDVKNWFKSFQKYMFQDVDNMELNDKGETPLLVSKEKTKRGLEVLKKYNLSVFSKNLNINNSIKNAILIDGNVYQDGWVSKKTRLLMNISNGNLYSEIYLPKKLIPNKMTLKIGEKIVLVQEFNKEKKYIIEIKVEESNNTMVEINFDKSIKPTSNGDNRELSAIINEFYFK